MIFVSFAPLTLAEALAIQKDNTGDGTMCTFSFHFFFCYCPIYSAECGWVCASRGKCMCVCVRVFSF